MRLDVPFYSQHAVEIPAEWRSRSCGVAALHMALAAKNASGLISTAALIEEGVNAGAYMSGIGWKHNGLLALAAAHGVAGYRKEFGMRKFSWRVRRFLAPIAHLFAHSGMAQLRAAIDAGAIPIVSLMLDNTKDTHLVTLIGYESAPDAGFYYHDPAGEESEKANRFMDNKTFARHWRQMALFIG